MVGPSRSSTPQSASALQAVLGLAVIAPPDVGEMLSAQERLLPGQVRERTPGSSDGERQAHAARRPRRRLFERREVGVRVDVCQSYGLRAGLVQAEQRAEQDAAVATDEDHELPVFVRGRDPVGELARVGSDVLLVPATPARLLQVQVARRRPEVTEVASVQPADEPVLAEHTRCQVETAGAAVTVGTDPDRRGRADDYGRAAHRLHLTR